MRRLLLPVLIPFGALIGTVFTILTFGLLLLWVGDYQWAGNSVGPLDFIKLATGDYPLSEVHYYHRQWDLGLFELSAPVVVATLLSIALLGGGGIVARWGKSHK